VRFGNKNNFPYFGKRTTLCTTTLALQYVLRLDDTAKYSKLVLLLPDCVVKRCTYDQNSCFV
jgi:hypothetical protein